MDIRTYPDELARLRAENVRLDCELRLRIQQLMDTSRAVGQLLTANETLRDNAAELSKALDMCIAERDGAFADADLARAELGTLRDERPRLLAANVRLFHDNNALKAELDNERNAHNATAAQLYAELAGAQDTATAAAQAWRTVTDERDALRAELDAMRQAHSVIAARMEAMGC